MREKVSFRSQRSILFLLNSVWVTYVTGCHTLTSQLTKCKHLLFYAKRLLFKIGYVCKIPYLSGQQSKVGLLVCLSLLTTTSFTIRYSKKSILYIYILILDHFFVY